MGHRRWSGALSGWAQYQLVTPCDARGVRAGLRCLEVGAGGGSLASRMCRRVESGGTVVATDLDTPIWHIWLIATSTCACAA
jgi:2-polyprenyl-3-methyl-5-hydroxy-6-metoxy-1,4-benzoquinol methylase